MIATEKEAREGWWCPMARVEVPAGDGTSVAGNRGDEYAEKACRCRASGCALWRWHDREFDHNGSPRPNRRGSCGLAPVGNTW